MVHVKKKNLKKIKETHLAAAERPLSICSHLLHCSSFVSLITRTIVMGRWPAGISFLAFINPFPSFPSPRSPISRDLATSPKKMI